jgi:hypothetical protein
LSRRDERIVASDPVAVRQLPDPKTSKARLTSPHARSDALTEAQRAVAIRALGWRLRVESNGAQSLRLKSWVVNALDLVGSGSCRTATGITACHPLVPSGQGAALMLVRKIDATSGENNALEDEDEDDDEDD